MSQNIRPKSENRTCYDYKKQCWVQTRPDLGPRWVEVQKCGHCYARAGAAKLCYACTHVGGLYQMAEEIPEPTTPTAQEKQSEKAAMLRHLARALTEAAEDRNLDFVDINLDGIVQVSSVRGTVGLLHGYTDRFTFCRNGDYIIVRYWRNAGDNTNEPVTQFDTTTQIRAIEWESVSRG